MEYNDIGISKDPDYRRIRHLMKIGLFGGLLALAGDMFLGWGVCDESLSGFDYYFSRYLSVSDSRIAAASFLGLIGISVECLSYFSIYRLIVCKSERRAHAYRSGLLGILMFGAMTHVLCCVTVYVGKKAYLSDPVTAVKHLTDFGLYFLLPVSILFFVFYILAAVVQFQAFRNGETPYPGYCRFFSMFSGLPVIMIMRLFGNKPWAYALSTGWISIGSIIMLSGLLIIGKRYHLK
ncbi:MAG: hypothetical protein IJG49_02345 [Erysipelotrichaceae bacterium]|nr:hypothetical protein [Erysipelotrichaceae bacterium]